MLHIDVVDRDDGATPHGGKESLCFGLVTGHRRLALRDADGEFFVQSCGEDEVAEPHFVHALIPSLRDAGSFGREGADDWAGEKDAGTAVAEEELRGAVFVHLDGVAEVVVLRVVESGKPGEEVRPAEVGVCFDEEVPVAIWGEGPAALDHVQEFVFV